MHDINHSDHAIQGSYVVIHTNNINENNYANHINHDNQVNQNKHANHIGNVIQNNYVNQINHADYADTINTNHASNDTSWLTTPPQTPTPAGKGQIL